MAERILIIDDDPVSRRLIEAMVTRIGYEAVTAESGAAGLAALTAEGARIDAVILDLVMPELDGLGVLGALAEAGISIPSSCRPRMAASTTSSRRCGPGRATSSSSRSAPSACRSRCATRWRRGRSKANSSCIKRSRAGVLTFKDIVTRSPRNAHRAAHGRESRRFDDPGAHRGRVGCRQGAHRARHPRHQRSARAARSSPSIAARSRTTWSNRSCSVTRRARSRARPSGIPASSSKPPAARCSSTRSANCRWPRR